jgi:hypothetical protein
MRVCDAQACSVTYVCACMCACAPVHVGAGVGQWGVPRYLYTHSAKNQENYAVNHLASQCLTALASFLSFVASY